MEIKFNLLIFMKLFVDKNYFFSLQHWIWVGLNHFESPNESVHSELYTFPPT